MFIWLLSFSRYLATKCMPLNNEKCEIRPTIIDLNPAELKYYPHIVTLNTLLYVTYTFQSESILYSCLNVKERLARSRHEIWNSSDCNWTPTQNHLVR